MAGAPPPDKRRILCVHCSRPLEVDVGAKSVNCRHCHKRVITEALTVKDYVAVRRFETANRLHITKKGIVFAAVRADDLVVDGVLEGSALALGSIKLTKKARVKGDLRACSLALDWGATYAGHLRIGRSEVAELDVLEPGAKPPPRREEVAPGVTVRPPKKTTAKKKKPAAKKKSPAGKKAKATRGRRT